MFITLKSGAMLNLYWLQDCFQGKHDKNIVIFYMVNGVKLIEDYETEQEALDRLEEVNKAKETAGAGGGLVQKDSFGDFPLEGSKGFVYLAKDTGQTYYWDEATSTYISIGTSGRTGVYSTSQSLPVLVGSSTTLNKSDLVEILKPTVPFSEGSEVIAGNSVHGMIVSTTATTVIVKTITDLTIDSFQQVSDKTKLPTTGALNILYYVQDTNDFMIWNGTDYESERHPVIIGSVPVANAMTDTIYVDGTTIKYTTDNVNWVEISTGTAMSEYKSDKTLNTTILGTTTLAITDLDTTLTINDLEKEQLVFDKAGTVAKITNIDTTTGDITVLTITIAGSGSGGVIGGNFDYDTGYSYTVDVAGTGYTIGDIVPTDIPTVFGKVAEVDTNGEIKAVTFTRKTTTSTTGTGASIKAVLDTNVFVIPDAEWSAGIAIFSLTNDDGAQVEFIRTDDVNTKYNMGADSKYYKFVYDPTEGCIIQSYSEIKGGGGDSKLIRDVKANLTVGAISSGSTILKDTTFTEFVEKLLIKELAPTISFSASNSGTKEIGTSVASSVFTLTITSLGTSTPTNIEFYVGSTKVDTQSYVSGTNSYTYTYTTPITSNTTVKGRLVYSKSDGTSTLLDASRTFTFVSPSYYGVTTKDSTTISSADILAMSKTLLTAKAYTQNNINLNNERIVYCYPASYGNLSVIKDGNNFDVTSSFDKVSLTINSVSYNCYILHDPTTDTGLKIVYS